MWGHDHNTTKPTASGWPPFALFASRRARNEPQADEATDAAEEAAAQDHPTIRVVLADDHRILRQGLVFLLSGEPDIEVVAEAADGQEAIEMARRHHPDIVVMDVTMPVLNGIEATRRIAAELPEIRVIGLSMHESVDMDQAMRDAGAARYLPKGGPLDALTAAIRELTAEDRNGPAPGSPPHDRR